MNIETLQYMKDRVIRGEALNTKINHIERFRERLNKMGSISIGCWDNAIGDSYKKTFTSEFVADIEKALEAEQKRYEEELAQL